MEQSKKDEIKIFLEGRDDQKYITGIEGDYWNNEIFLMIDDPEKGKYLEKHRFTPFCFIKDYRDLGFNLYRNNKIELKNAKEKHGIKIKNLRTDNHPRLEHGYKYLVTTSKKVGNIKQFFENGGLKMYDRENNLFIQNPSVEQFLISSGKRLFKGYTSYNDIHKFYFDIETTSLKPEFGNIFLIGMKDNRGFQKVLEIDLNNSIESERQMIIDLFEIIVDLKPAIVAGYNSENFDFSYILGRAEILGINFGTKDQDGNMYFDVATSLNPSKPISRKKSTIKFGGETENYEQTLMWGINVIDISHAVRQAKAINSEIQYWGLKYICQYSNIAKPNRMYVIGDKIYKIWEENKNYFINKANNEYKLIPENSQNDPDYINKLKKWFIQGQKEDAIEKLKQICEFFSNDINNIGIISGKEIVFQYLQDDLFETEAVDNMYNQASFMLGSNLPTSFVRTNTMGGAVKWKLLLTTYSYEKELAIPINDKKRDIVGGLSRVFLTGYSTKMVKKDYKSLYPSIELTHDVFSTCDIDGVQEAILSFFRDNRIELQLLAKDYEKIDKVLSTFYDTKQLPIKTLTNTQFGAASSPEQFNWGDNNCGEETTCRGRQYLRLMTWFYISKGFKPVVGDSVTFDTPVYIKYKKNNYIDIKPICELFNEKSDDIDEEGLRDYEKKEYEILTVNGWKQIGYVYKHETTKNIHIIRTKNRLINVTEDHSLFQNNIEIKPKDLKIGDNIDIYEIPKFSQINGINLEKAWLYGFFLGDGSSLMNRRATSSYKSRKTGLKTNSKGSMRYDWKISNSRIKYLEKLQKILKSEFNITANIKDHMKSSAVHDLTCYNKFLCRFFCESFYTSYREKKIPFFILNANDEIKRAFLEGVCASDGYGDTIEECSDIGMKSQIAMAGLALILKNLNIEYKISIRKDKPNFINFSLKSKRKNGVVKDFGINLNRSKLRVNQVASNDIYLNNHKNSKLQKYVYDVSTKDGTFIGGIGGVNLHNTDGINFLIPDNVNDNKYLNKDSKEFIGYQAVLAEFNEKYMTGVMKLEEDGEYEATINFSRKNYVNLKSDGKIKITGNSLKSGTMPTFIKKFFNKGLKLLLFGNGKEFVENYYIEIERIYNGQVPLMEIANKSRVKLKNKDYLYELENKVDINGRKSGRKAYCELLMKAGLDPDLGSTVFYVNNGTAMSHNDIEHSYLISEKEFETDPNKLGEYNVKKYIKAFNEKVKMLLICFDDNVRSTLLIKNPKDRQFYTDQDMILINGKPIKKDGQDCLYLEEYKETDKDVPLFEMENREIVFWNKVGKDPREIFPYFTTELSDVRLLTQEEQKIKILQQEKIIEFFDSQGCTIKTEMDYLRHNDEVIIFRDKFITYEMVDDEDKKTGLIKEKKKEQQNIRNLKSSGYDISTSNDFMWILTKYKTHRKQPSFEDIEILDPEIYDLESDYQNIVNSFQTINEENLINGMYRDI